MNPRAQASSTSTTGSSSISWEVASRCSIATKTGSLISIWPEEPIRARLYRNNSPLGGALRFGKLLDAPSSNLTGVTGAYPIDIDSDTHTDLAVLRFGEDVLLRGNGDCTFERANENWSLDARDDWTVGFSATWEGDAAMPTLAFGNYLAEGGQLTGTCADHFLFRPEDGRYAEPVTLTPGFCTLSVLFSDWDRSGRAICA